MPDDINRTFQELKDRGVGVYGSSHKTTVGPFRKVSGCGWQSVLFFRPNNPAWSFNLRKRFV